MRWRSSCLVAWGCAISYLLSHHHRWTNRHLSTAFRRLSKVAQMHRMLPQHGRRLQCLKTATGILMVMDEAEELRIRMERRLGEIRAKMPKAPAGRPNKKISSQREPISKPPTLADLGISKKVSSRAMKLLPRLESPGKPLMLFCKKRQTCRKLQNRQVCMPTSTHPSTTSGECCRSMAGACNA